MAEDNIGVKPFTTTEIGSSQPKYKNRATINSLSSKSGLKTYKYASKSHKHKKMQYKIPTNLVAKVGVCVLACAFMLALKGLDNPIAEQVVAGVKVAVNDETDFTEMFGKLQFVELPETLEVFSNSDKLALPVSAPSQPVDSEQEYVLWEGIPDTTVLAAAAGKIRAVSEDDVLGKYVRIQHDNNLETIYYGLAEISVEQGQPIKKFDTLGITGEEGTLCVYVMLDGKPQSPGEYMDLIV